MSRSIHDTFTVAAIEWQTAVRKDTDEAWQRASAVRDNIRRQRSIRRRVRQSRARAAPLAMTADSVPILCQLGHGLHHGASERDLREVMRRLPPGSLDGLGTVELRAAPPHVERAPLCGVHMPTLAGRYLESDRGIRVFAFEVAEPLEADLACLLRMSALGTFLHELAHHFDFMFRTTGDRWRMDDRAKTEAFARGRALAQLADVVVPYLVEAYPDDTATIERWSARLELLV